MPTRGAQVNLRVKRRGWRFRFVFVTAFALTRRGLIPYAIREDGDSEDAFGGALAPTRGGLIREANDDDAYSYIVFGRAVAPTGGY